MYQQSNLNRLLYFTLWLLLALIIPISGMGAPENISTLPRMALVIGNSDYQSNLYNLSNPVNDAVSLAAELRKLGFEVTELANLTKAGMEAAINDFAMQLYDKQAVGLFYFSGHGMQYQGQSYLIPVDAMEGLKFAQQLRYAAVAESWVLDTLGAANNSLNIVLLDACRDNPLATNILGNRGKLKAGLGASSSPPNNFIISYAAAAGEAAKDISDAAAAGEAAKDGAGSNSPYIVNLLSALRQPGLTIESVFKQVRKGVMVETNMVQKPQYYSAFSDEFIFNPAVTFEVRGHYHIHSDGTVTDTRTGLMWKRCAEGQTWTSTTCSGNLTQNTGMTWYKVISNGQQKSWPAFAGYIDWRVPTREELRTLVYCSNGTLQETAWDKTCSGKGWDVDSDSYTRPTIDQVVFPNVPWGSWFWSASAYVSASSLAWGLDFAYGDGNWLYRSYAGQVRLVRVGGVQ